MNLPDQSNREAWLGWRRKGIGSSDVPAIMNACPYKTAFEIFQDKTGRVVKADTGNFATERGVRLEPIARQKFSARYNMLYNADETFQPKLYQMAEMPFMRTSLDGQSFDGKTNIEIKHVGKAAWADAINGVVPTHHQLQIQHQMLVSGAEHTFHVAINEAEEIIANEIWPDQVAMDEIVLRCQLFWGWVTTNKWPGESDDSLMREMFRQYANITDQIKELEVRRKSLQETIFGTDVEVCDIWRVNTITRKGNVKYDRIPELKGVDLERYRGPESVYKTITKV